MRRSTIRRGHLTACAAEPLEGRRLFAFISLGEVGDVPVVANDSVSLSEGRDSQGNFSSLATPDTLAFEIARPLARLEVNATPTNVGEFASGNLRVRIARDSDGNGELSQTELSQTVHEFVATSGTLTIQPIVALEGGGYFAYLNVTDYVPGPAVGVLKADVKYILSLVAEPVEPGDIRVQFGTTDIADDDSTPDVADGTAFGTGVQYQPGPQRTFTVSNPGQSPLLLGSISVPDGFEVITGLPPDLAAGGSASFAVALRSDTPGAKQGFISFATNVPGRTPFGFAVQGEVLEGTAAGLSISSVESSLPATVVGGTKGARGTVLMHLTAAGGFAGLVTASVFASQDGTVNPADDLLLGQVARNVRLRPGQVKALKVKATAPATDEPADWQILAEVSGAALTGAITAAGPTPIRIEPPVVAFESSLPAVQNLVRDKPNRVGIELSNIGNVAAKGKLELALSLVDGLGGTTSLPAVQVPVAIAPNAAKAIRLKLAALDPLLPAGNYTLHLSIASGALGEVNFSPALVGLIPVTLT